MQEALFFDRLVRAAIIVTVALPAASRGEPRPEEIPAVHIVRPGDTLRGISGSYLGTEGRWNDLWGLNPDIEDPNFLLPGQRVRVLVRLADATPAARILSLSGKVENRPAPIDWSDAHRQDLLVERDALRTRGSSSSALQFPDGSNLLVSERSLVYMRRAGRSLRGVEERKVEIVEGQADLEALTDNPVSADIEIVVGGALAKPTTDESGSVQARARKAEGGGAAVMVFEGASEVEAAGQTVAVERGMGTAVPESGPPAAPEKLLEPPVAGSPEASSRWDFPDPLFSWEAVEGAAAYVVDVCFDPGCRDLVRRGYGIEDLEWRPEPLPVAELFWRVHAVSASGLDGYASPSLGFEILSDRQDREPPHAVGLLEGPSVTARGTPVTKYYAPSASLTISVEDDRTGVAEWWPQVNGRRVDKAALSGGWEDGEQRVEIVARDVAGNEGTEEVARFHVDAEAPVIEWGPGDTELLVPFLGENPVDDRWQRKRRRWLRRAHHKPGPERAAWVLVAWNSDLFETSGGSWRHPDPRRRRRSHVQSLANTGSQPRMAVLAPNLELGDGEVLGDRLLVVGATDAKAGTVRLTLRTVIVVSGAGQRKPYLEIEAVDRLLNRRIERLGFAEPPAGRR